jgi:hypothetical protein
MYLVETESGGVDWIGLAQDRDRRWALVNVVMSLRVPHNAGKLSSGCITGGISSSAQLHSQLTLHSQTALTKSPWVCGSCLRYI